MNITNRPSNHDIDHFSNNALPLAMPAECVSGTQWTQDGHCARHPLESSRVRAVYLSFDSIPTPYSSINLHSKAHRRYVLRPSTTQTFCIFSSLHFAWTVTRTRSLIFLVLVLEMLLLRFFHKHYAHNSKSLHR